jgi:hypothetical protein
MVQAKLGSIPGLEGVVASSASSSAASQPGAESVCGFDHMRDLLSL